MKQVIDASTLLAYLQGEEGAASAKRYIQSSAMSSINYSEVIQKAMRQGSHPIVEAIIKQAAIRIVPFERDHAFAAAKLHEATVGKAISIADRACLATGQMLGLPVVTGDKAWKEISVGVKVVLFRGDA